MKNFGLGILEIPASQYQIPNILPDFDINKICLRLCYNSIYYEFCEKNFCKFWNFVSVGASTLINFLIILCYILGVVGQQLISRVRKKCPTSSEASLKKQFIHCFSQLDSFSGASLATGLALTWTPNKNKKPSRVGIIRKLAILVKICKKSNEEFCRMSQCNEWFLDF